MAVDEQEILLDLLSGSKSLRELQKDLDEPHWNNLHHHIFDKKDSLMDRGCVEVETTYPDAQNGGRIERKIRLRDEGCLL